MTVDGPANGNGSGQALTLEGTSQALLGEVAEWYKTTRAVTNTLNGSTDCWGIDTRATYVSRSWNPAMSSDPAQAATCVFGAP